MVWKIMVWKIAVWKNCIVLPTFLLGLLCIAVFGSQSVLSSDTQRIAPSHQNPGADVSLLTKQFVQEGLTNQAFDVVVAITAGILQRGKMIVNLNTSNGLDIVEGDLSTIFILDGTFDYSIPLMLKVSRPGKYYVDMNIIIETDGKRPIQRALSASVLVNPEEVALQKEKLLKQSLQQTSVTTLPSGRVIKFLDVTEER